eukprot:1278982-Amphidinium_carterae.1
MATLTLPRRTRAAAAFGWCSVVKASRAPFLLARYIYGSVHRVGKKDAAEFAWLQCGIDVLSPFGLAGIIVGVVGLFVDYFYFAPMWH